MTVTEGQRPIDETKKKQIKALIISNPYTAKLTSCVFALDLQITPQDVVNRNYLREVVSGDNIPFGTGGGNTYLAALMEVHMSILYIYT